jgi:hypothetical protein
VSAHLIQGLGLEMGLPPGLQGNPNPPTLAKAVACRKLEDLDSRVLAIVAAFAGREVLGKLSKSIRWKAYQGLFFQCQALQSDNLIRKYVVGGWQGEKTIGQINACRGLMTEWIRDRENCLPREIDTAITEETSIETLCKMRAQILHYRDEHLIQMFEWLQGLRPSPLDKVDTHSPTKEGELPKSGPFRESLKKMSFQEKVHAVRDWIERNGKDIQEMDPLICDWARRIDVSIPIEILHIQLKKTSLNMIFKYDCADRRTGPELTRALLQKLELQAVFYEALNSAILHGKKGAIRVLLMGLQSQKDKGGLAPLDNFKSAVLSSLQNSAHSACFHRWLLKRCSIDIITYSLYCYGKEAVWTRIVQCVSKEKLQRVFEVIFNMGKRGNLDLILRERIDDLDTKTLCKALFEISRGEVLLRGAALTASVYAISQESWALGITSGVAGLWGGITRAKVVDYFRHIGLWFYFLRTNPRGHLEDAKDAVSSIGKIGRVLLERLWNVRKK